MLNSITAARATVFDIYVTMALPVGNVLSLLGWITHRVCRAFHPLHRFGNVPHTRDVSDNIDGLKRPVEYKFLLTKNCSCLIPFRFFKDHRHIEP